MGCTLAYLGLWKKQLCWFRCRKKSSRNGFEFEHKQKACCFIRKILLHTSLWLQWLLCMIEVLNWLNQPSYFPDLTACTAADLHAGALSWWNGTPFISLQAIFDLTFLYLSLSLSFKVLDYCPMWMYLRKNNTVSIIKDEIKYMWPCITNLL